MQNKTKMIKRRFRLFLAVIFIAVLALTVSGCGRDEVSLDGLYIATFELEGGTLMTPTSSVNSNINFAYHPGTYVLNPLELNGYSITRPEYEFTGWYTDKSCTESSKWDFENSVINNEKLTFYAGWRKAVKLTYTLYYTDEVTGELVALGSYRVESGAFLNDLKNYAKGREGYTATGYFSDVDCTTAWDNAFTHPGTDTDLDVPVYINYMKGNWAFVDSVSALESAIKNGKDVYLKNDIDCGGKVLSFGSYSGEFNGNGYTVSNFTVEKEGLSYVDCSLFDTLNDGAIIRDVSFTQVTYDVTISDSDLSFVMQLTVAALAMECRGTVTVSNVTIEGQMTTNYTDNLPESIGFTATDSTDQPVITNSEVNITIVTK